LRDPRGNAGIERGKIGFHRSGFEGDRQCPPVQAVLVEIEQQSVRAETADQGSGPSHAWKRIAWLVEQHQFIGVGSSSTTLVSPKIWLR